MKREILYAMLEEEVLKRNIQGEISEHKPDPLLIASKYKDEYIALICALFSYGDVRAIVNFLGSLDFSLLDKNEDYKKYIPFLYREYLVKAIVDFDFRLPYVENKDKLKILSIKKYVSNL